jgi:hypothetical protein
METGLAEEDSEQSAEGTLLHKLDANPTLDRSKLTPAQRDLLDTAAKLRSVVLTRVLNQFGITKEEECLSGHELEMWLHRGIKALYPGHCDDWFYWPARKLLLIIDKKFGYKVVTEASANRQLRSYAVGGSELYDCENVVVAITQPRLSFDEQITMAVYSREDIAASREQLFTIWSNAKKPNAPLVAGEEQCRYCLAKLLCDAYKAKFLTIAEGINRTTKATAHTSLAQLSDDQLSRVLEAIQFAGFIADNAKEVARERIKAGGLPGWKLGKESEVREVTDVPVAVAALEAIGIPLSSIKPALKMKIGDIEGAYRKAHGDQVTWKDAKDAVNTALEGLIEKHPKRPSVERVA